MKVSWHSTDTPQSIVCMQAALVLSASCQAAHPWSSTCTYVATTSVVLSRTRSRLYCNLSLISPASQYWTVEAAVFYVTKVTGLRPCAVPENSCDLRNVWALKGVNAHTIVLSSAYPCLVLLPQTRLWLSIFTVLPYVILFLSLYCQH